MPHSAKATRHARHDTVGSRDRLCNPLLGSDLRLATGVGRLGAASGAKLANPLGERSRTHAIRA